MSAISIGVIGLGNKGAAIAANLLRSGHSVTVWNRSATNAAALETIGALRFATSRAAANGQIVITMLADDAAIRTVMFDGDGVFVAAARPLQILMSTINIRLVGRLTESHNKVGSALVSAPAFDRPAAAEAAKL